MGAAPPADTAEMVMAEILNECQQSAGLHARRAKELVEYRWQHKDGAFLTHFWKVLLPLFMVFKREPAAERLVKFVVTFVTFRDEKQGSECDAFLEEFFGLLLFSADSVNKAVRLRVCQILSEVILRLNENAEVSDDVWDDVIESMHRRMQDKVPAVRVYSARALARFASAEDGSRDPENDAILRAYQRSLQSDQNAEVRRNVILSMPPSNATVHHIVKHTADVDEGVRKTAFFVLSKKFPIQSLSIKERNLILQRGLHDRREGVKAECLKMLKDVWLMKCCQGDAIALMKYLDVETNETVGEAVMLALLKVDAVSLENFPSLQTLLAITAAEIGPSVRGCQLVRLLEAEEALYWRVAIRYLHSEAQAKGHDAAVTGGAQAAINAAAAKEKNALLDRVLPSTMTEYVQLVKAHMDAEPHTLFVTRQLLLIGKYMDFSDATNRKVADIFLHDIMCKSAGHCEENEVLLGDGVSLGGDKQWSQAIAELAWKVHETHQEFEKMASDVLAELGSPCREGGATVEQWIHCLAAVGFLLENIESLHRLAGRAIEAHELLGGLLLPAAKHVHPEVQRAAVRSLGMFCIKEAKPSLSAIKQLRLALLNGISPVQKMATKALFDLCMWHGVQVLDRCIGPKVPSQGRVPDTGDPEGDSGLPILEIFAQKLDLSDTEFGHVEGSEAGDGETLPNIIAEGFAKMLLQSKDFTDILPLEQCVFVKLLRLYFNEETSRLPRLRQCLAVFFETYPSVSLHHKGCIAKSFLPAIGAEWPGIYGNGNDTHMTVTAKRKHVTKLAKFMLQMLHQPLFEDAASIQVSEKDEALEQENLSSSKEEPKHVAVFDEELAVHIVVEVIGFSSQRSAAAKSYLLMLSKILCSLEFRQSEQELVKCLRQLLNNAKDVVIGDKQAAREIVSLEARLQALDNTPEDGLSNEQLETILRNLAVDEQKAIEPQQAEANTPAPRNKTKSSRCVKRVRSRIRDSTPPSPIADTATPQMPPTTARAQRASKTAAMGKIRSDLAPSKRAIYASSEEDLVSPSSSDSSSEDELSDSDCEQAVLQEKSSNVCSFTATPEHPSPPPHSENAFTARKVPNRKTKRNR